jgi:hypothetical protein
MVQGRVELVDRVRSEGISHLGSIEGNTNDAGVLGPVIGDIGEGEVGDLIPDGGVEYLRNHERRG